MPYIAPEPEPTWMDRLANGMAFLVIVGALAWLSCSMIETARNQAYHRLKQDECHCLGCGS